MTPAIEPSLRLWDDNPTFQDLLGFDAVIQPILEAIATPTLDPVTIGVQSPWGGGKSTIINLLDDLLIEDPRYIVIRCDPWQYDTNDDVRQLFIADVLDALATRFKDDAAINERAADLLARISWSRVALAIGKGALTMQWNIEELVKAFTPTRRSAANSMSGFKDSFAEMLDLLPNIERVIVLIDDLDRCLPAAVMGALEAIKLFLAAPKMVFVLAADQDLIRDAVAAHLAGTNRSEAFARRYLEKIVQLPISLPRLSAGEAETYITLLLATHEAPDEDSFNAVVEHAASRRRANLWPLHSEWPSEAWRPSDEALRLASQLTRGLSADRLSSPRQIKRFLNAYGVRFSVAATRGVEIPPAVLIKMLLLEDLHRAAFESLAAWPVAERQTRIKEWEDWAHARTDSLPAGIDEATREWAQADPSLVDYDLTSYLRLAASLVDTTFGGSVSDEVVSLVHDLLDDSDAVRMSALSKVTQLTPPEQISAMNLLLESGRQGEDLNAMCVSAIRWAKDNPSLAELVRDSVRENARRLTLAAPAELMASGVPVLVDLVAEIAGSTEVPEAVAEAAKIELEP